MAQRRFKFWGWGLEDELVGDREADGVASHVAGLFGAKPDSATTPPTAEEISLPASKLVPPTSVAEFCSTDHVDRLIHTYGKSYFDSARCMERDFKNPPDVVAKPRNEEELAAVLDWAQNAGAAVIPFGAGSSVVGGTEAQFCESYNGVITLNTQQLRGVTEVDPVSRVARIRAGTLGPEIEDTLRDRGMTLRHFPQSFAYSTLGGWIACRAAGHFATLYTHTEDLVESLRVVTPKGVMESRRIPTAGTGPSEDRLLCGSEGALGIITEAWMKIRPVPRYREATAVSFDDYFKAASAVRAMVQAGLSPANCRLISEMETKVFSPGSLPGHKIMLGFENGDVPVTAFMAIAVQIALDHGGRVDPKGTPNESGNKAGDSGNWRNAFLRMPYYRETMTQRGIIFDTFATSITWERFEAFHVAVKADVEDAIRRVTGNEGLVTTRFSHVYHDGPAPYFTFFAKGRQGSLSKQWAEIRSAALESVHKNGGPATHHQAIGRFHRPWYDKQRSPLFAEALKAAKRAVDPNGILNPGVLVDPQPAF